MIADIKQDIEVLPEVSSDCPMVPAETQNSDERVKVLVVDPIVTLFKDGLTSTTAQGELPCMTCFAQLTGQATLLW